jgi:hypothetical protein
MTNQLSTGNLHLRDTHPNLYRSMTTIGLVESALGLNFLLTTPTFQQFGIPKNLIGAGFLSLGLAYMVFLNVYRSIRIARMLTVIGTTFMVFWGVGTTETFFAGKSSLQLCILYFGLAALQAPLLLEPFLNPVTANGKK